MRSSRVELGPHAAAKHRAALVLGQPAPDAGLLAGLQGPLEAVVDDVARTADRLGVIDLEQRRATGADGEEQLRIFVTAGGAVSPVHGVFPPSGGARCPTLSTLSRSWADRSPSSRSPPARSRTLMARSRDVQTNFAPDVRTPFG